MTIKYGANQRPATVAQGSQEQRSVRNTQLPALFGRGERVDCGMQILRQGEGEVGADVKASDDDKLTFAASRSGATARASISK